MLSFISFNA